MDMTWSQFASIFLTQHDIEKDFHMRAKKGYVSMSFHTAKSLDHLFGEGWNKWEWIDSAGAVSSCMSIIFRTTEEVT